MPSIFANSLTYSNSIGLGDAALTLQNSLGPELASWQTVSSLVCAAPVAALQATIATIAANSAAFLPLAGGAMTGALSLTVASGSPALINLSGEASGVAIRTYRFSSDVTGANYTGFKARGTIASPLVCASGDTSGGIVGSFYDGINSFHTGGQIQFVLIDTNPSSTFQTQFQMRTVTVNSTNLVNLLVGDQTNGLMLGGVAQAQQFLDMNRYHILRGLSVAVISASTTNSFATAFATNEGGGGQPVYFDGTVWRRFSDCNVMSTGNKQPQSDFFVRSVPTTGFAYTNANNVQTIILDPAGTLATGAITTCASPFDGQEVRISTSQIITAFTYTANAGQTIDGGFAAAALAANGFFAHKWVNASTTWYRIG